MFALSWEHHPIKPKKLIHSRQFFCRRSAIDWWQRVTAESEENEDFSHFAHLGISPIHFLQFFRTSDGLATSSHEFIFCALCSFGQSRKYWRRCIDLYDLDLLMIAVISEQLSIVVSRFSQGSAWGRSFDPSTKY